MNKIGFASLFKMPKPRHFNYRPMYYDADKENLQARIDAIEAEVKAEKEPYKPDSEHFRKRMDREWVREKDRQFQTVNVRVIVIAGLLAVAIYAFLYL